LKFEILLTVLKQFFIATINFPPVIIMLKTNFKKDLWDIQLSFSKFYSCQL